MNLNGSIEKRGNQAGFKEEVKVHTRQVGKQKEFPPDIYKKNKLDSFVLLRTLR
jgi:hypothetical protein